MKSRQLSTFLFKFKQLNNLENREQVLVLHQAQDSKRFFTKQKIMASHSSLKKEYLNLVTVKDAEIARILMTAFLTSNYLGYDSMESNNNTNYKDKLMAIEKVSISLFSHPFEGEFNGKGIFSKSLSVFANAKDEKLQLEAVESIITEINEITLATLTPEYYPLFIYESTHANILGVTLRRKTRDLLRQIGSYQDVKSYSEDCSVDFDTAKNVLYFYSNFELRQISKSDKVNIKFREFAKEIIKERI